MLMRGLCSVETVGFGWVRRNGHEMRYHCASGVGHALHLGDAAAGLTVYRRYPTLCAVMVPNPLLPT